MPYKIGLIVLINLVFYYRTLFYYFVSDDLAPAGRPIDKDTYEFKDGNRYKVKGWLHRVWLHFIGVAYWSPPLAHGLTLFVHIANCILIYYAFGANHISFLAAILFSINPVNTQGGAVWCSGRIYGITTMLVLLMFLMPKLGYYFYFLTKVFSVNGMFSPLIFVGTKHWSLVWLIIIGFFLNKKILEVKKVAGTNNEMAGIYPHKIISYIKSLAYYITLCLWCHTLALYHTFIWGVGVNRYYNKDTYAFNKQFWYSLPIVLAFFYAIYHYWGTPIGLGLFWFFINISMWCNVITYQQQINERVVYTANVGLMYALAYAIAPYPYVVLALLVYYATRLVYILPMYENEYWHTQYSMIEAKRCNYIWISKGYKKFRMNDFQGAYYDFQEARVNTPHEFKANYNVASMCLLLGNIPEAVTYLEEAKRCMYEGQEEKMMESINESYKVIEDMKRTGKVDASKVLVIR